MRAYAAVGLIVALLVTKRCDLLSLEDKAARSLGLDVNKNRIFISAVAVLLASISTAIIGPISFLGLIVPHIARLLVGTSHKWLVPYSMLLGAFCLLLADTLGRTIAAPYEISAAVIMSVVGRQRSSCCSERRVVPMANNENEQLTAAPSAGAADEMEGRAGASLTDSVPAAPVFTVSGLQFAYDHGACPYSTGWT